MSAQPLDEAQRGLLQRLLALPAADWEIVNVWERRAGFTVVIAAWIAAQQRAGLTVAYYGGTQRNVEEMQQLVLGEGGGVFTGTGRTNNNSPIVTRSFTALVERTDLVVTIDHGESPVIILSEWVRVHYTGSRRV